MFVCNSGDFANWVGFSDATDYKMIKLESAAILNLTLQATDKAKLTLWAVSYSAKTGKYSLTSKGTLSVTKTGDLSVKTWKTGSGKLLEAGDYFVSVESTNAKKVPGGNAYYNVGIATDTVFFDSADNGANNWGYDKKASPAINPNLETIVISDAGSKKTNVVLDSNAMTVEGFSNFVGHNDKADYARFAITADGTAQFAVTASGAGTFVVYQLNEAKGKLMALDTIKITAAGQTVTGQTLNLTAGEYFISMTAKDTKKGNVYYNVEATTNLKEAASFSLDMPEASISDAVDSLNFAQNSADTLALGSAFSLNDDYQLDDKSSWQNIAKLA